MLVRVQPDLVPVRPAVEPLVAAQWQQGREQTRYAHTVFWARMADEGRSIPGSTCSG